MSNKIVPTIYRTVIDEVIDAIKSEFDEYGVGEEVLADLQRKWESKVIASHVAEFESPQPAAPPPAPPQAPHHHAYPPHAMHMMPTHAHYAPHNPYTTMANLGAPPAVKTEPMDNKYMLASGIQYSLPSLPGPTINGSRQLPPPIPHPGGQTSVLSFPRPSQTQNSPAPSARPYVPPSTQQLQQSQSQPQTPQQHPQRIPQTDGPSESSGDEDTPSPPPSQSSAFAPRASHPSLPQPSTTTTPASSRQEDSEAINSDLDDSDTEGEEEADEGTAGETDIVFCTYDKVARVKNKWKCILKDGMIHINSKDYLFAKCTGEFEW